MTLPSKIKGQYWITDISDSGKPRELISIEAFDGEWIVKSNRLVSILDSENKIIQNSVLKPLSFFNLKIAGCDERVILFAEAVDDSRQSFKKIVVQNASSFRIGRTADNNLCFENKYVSGKHAKLSYDGENWTIIDTNSTNGTYVNGYRVDSQALYPGDFIYIMGLKIVVGHRFFAINNPDDLLHINAQSLTEYTPQEIETGHVNGVELPEKNFFYRSPRFKREIEKVEIKIDAPPQLQKLDTVPLALMLGPSLTMGMTSLSTGLLTLSNVMSNGGNITQALPTLMMSVSIRKETSELKVNFFSIMTQLKR